MNENKTESAALADEVLNDLPKTKVKGVDYVALAAMIMEIIKFLMNLWKKNKTPSEADAVAMQEHAANLGPIQRLLVKFKVRRHIHRYNKQHRDVYDKVEDDVFNSTIKKIGGLSPKVIHAVAQENIKND